MTQSQSVTVFGSRDEVREISTRLTSMMLPGGKHLNNSECLVLAQLAVAHGLDPFNGEIWMLPTGPMIGIKGLRKKARQQISNGKAGNFWCNFRELSNQEERARLLIPNGALAFECRLMDSETINNYVSTIKALKEAGMPWETIESIVGAQPYTSGYGYYKAGENTKMSPVQVAMKRAEADAIKRRFDVPFGIMVEGDGGDIEEQFSGEWKNVTPDELRPPEQIKADRASANTALFGEDDTQPAPQPEPPARVVTVTAVKEPAPTGKAPTSEMWKRYDNLCQQAIFLGIDFHPPAPDCDYDTLKSAGVSLAQAVKSAQAAQAVNNA